ncbi:MAG TPA: hypothetical protein VK960_04580 [Acidimicrobiia bacterium]|nr:hypothetical protein [Acidimicrobiia bacterium]
MAEQDTSRDDYPAKIADFLEAIAARIRSMTVDRIARVITFVTLGLVALTLVTSALIFFLVGLFRIVGEVTRKACDCTRYMEISYAIVGGLFLLLGALLWSKRIRKPSEEES